MHIFSPWVLVQEELNFISLANMLVVQFTNIVF